MRKQQPLLDCASDPEKAVVAYAKAFSRCGVCGKGLLNDVSIARGIGPICAGKVRMVNLPCHCVRFDRVAVLC